MKVQSFSFSIWKIEAQMYWQFWSLKTSLRYLVTFGLWHNFNGSNVKRGVEPLGNLSPCKNVQANMYTLYDKQSNWSLLLSPEYKKLKATLEWILPTLPNVLPVMTKLLKLKIKQTFDKEIISSLFQVCIQQYNLIQ